MTRRSGARYVVIGGGLAGFRAAERFCERGLGRHVTVVAAERHAPYNRPPLSKQLIDGTMRPRDLRLQAFADLAGVTWRGGTRVLGLDPERRVVRLPGREEVPYDGLVIATGMEGRHLPGAPTHSPSVWGLRTIEDARGLSRAVARARDIAVIGGGFIGGELASSLRARGRRVTIVDRAPVLMQRALGDVLGQAVTAVHREAGVGLRLGAGLDQWEQRRHGWRLHLDDGDAPVEADVVAVGVGTVPAVDWLDGLGLDLSDGILCTPTTHVVGLEQVVACGDVARWANDRFDALPRRVEHWINAVEMARHAVDSLLAGPAFAAPFRPIPRFWSEQHGMRIQAVGVPSIGDRFDIVDGLLSKRRRLLAASYVGDRVVGAVAINDPVKLIEFAAELERLTDAQPVERPVGVG